MHNSCCNEEPLDRVPALTWEETHLGKVRLRSSLTNCGLPVFTGRPGSLVPTEMVSVCLLAPRRLRTDMKDRQRSADAEKQSDRIHWRNIDFNSLTDGPWVTWQFGQWYRSISAALSSSTPTQLQGKHSQVSQTQSADRTAETCRTYAQNNRHDMLISYHHILIHHTKHYLDDTTWDQNILPPMEPVLTDVTLNHEACHIVRQATQAVHRHRRHIVWWSNCFLDCRCLGVLGGVLVRVLAFRFLVETRPVRFTWKPVEVQGRRISLKAWWYCNRHGKLISGRWHGCTQPNISSNKLRDSVVVHNLTRPSILEQDTERHTASMSVWSVVIATRLLRGASATSEWMVMNGWKSLSLLLVV